MQFRSNYSPYHEIHSNIRRGQFNKHERNTRGRNYNYIHNFLNRNFKGHASHRESFSCKNNNINVRNQKGSYKDDEEFDCTLEIRIHHNLYLQILSAIITIR